MTVFELVKSMSLEQTAELLATCYDVPDGCESCPCKATGLCGYPELDCCESVENLLRSEETEIIKDSLYSMNRKFGDGSEAWIRRSHE